MRHGNQVEEFYSYLIAPSQPSPRTKCVGKGEKIETYHEKILTITFPTENCKDWGMSLATAWGIQPECMEFWDGYLLTDCLLDSYIGLCGGRDELWKPVIWLPASQ